MSIKKRIGKHGHKKTVYCPLKKCNYTSRIMIVEDMDNKISNHSQNCPHHRMKLVGLSDKTL